MADAREPTNTRDGEPMRWVSLAVFVVALLLFLPAVRYGYTGWDDTLYVVNNPHLTAPDGLARIWTTRESDQYYPLTFTSFWLEYRLWGPTPAGYHATNAVLHALDAVLVLALLRTLGSSRAAAAFGALLFAMHPLQVMSVAWIAERKNLLSGCFALLATLAWIHSFRRSARWSYWASLACFALAMLSKTAVLGLPLSLIVLHRSVLRATWRSALVRATPMLALGAASVLVTVLFERKFVDAVGQALIPELPERVQIAGAAPWVYLFRFVLPLDLSPAYPLWHPSASSPTWWLPTIASASAVGVIASLSRRLDARVTWGLAHFVALLAPSLGVIAFGNLALTHVSDHFVYVASIGLCAVAATAAENALARWPATTKVCGAGVLALCAFATLSLMPVYSNGSRFWGRVVQRDPQNFFGNSGFAALAMTRGDAASTLAHARRAYEVAPNAVDAQVLLARAQLLANDLAAAEQTLARVLVQAPDDGSVLAARATLLERTGRLQEAVVELERAVQVDPESVDARLALADARFRAARYAEAEPLFRAVTLAQPGAARAWLGLVMCEYFVGHHANAVATARAGLEATDGDVDLRERLAFILATSADDAVRRGEEAVALIEPLVDVVRSTNPYMLNTLAAAYAEVRRFDEAVKLSQRAAEVAERAGDRRMATECRARAELYGADKPMRR